MAITKGELFSFKREERKVVRDEKRERNEELFLWSWKRAEGGGEVREGLLVLGTETK